MTNPVSRTLTLGLALLGILSLLSQPARAQTAGGTRIGPCAALRTSDDDSVDLRCGSELVRVRMRNVAAPRPGQVGYPEAARALSELVRARVLYVVPETPGELPLDPNGRVLAYLVDRSGANLNVAFVLLGWATYSDDGGASRLERSFRTAEADARSEQRALWTVWSISAGGAGGR